MVRQISIKICWLCDESRISWNAAANHESHEGRTRFGPLKKVWGRKNVRSYKLMSLQRMLWWTTASFIIPQFTAMAKRWFKAKDRPHQGRFRAKVKPQHLAYSLSMIKREAMVTWVPKSSPKFSPQEMNRLKTKLLSLGTKNLRLSKGKTRPRVECSLLKRMSLQSIK